MQTPGMNQTVENEKLASYSPEGAGWLPLNVGGLFNPLVVVWMMRFVKSSSGWGRLVVSCLGD